MLRVALTGGLGAGKSTVARLFRALGAHILSSDEMAREMMRPGQQVYAAIIARFGPQVVLPDGELDRAALARIAFAEGRVEALNAIVHPAVIARQALLTAALAAQQPGAVVMVESALIFETKHSGEESWRRRFDKVILVTAPEEQKIARFIQRVAKGAELDEPQREALEAEAHRRIAQQIPDEEKASMSDYVIVNSGPLTELEWQVDQLWPILQAEAAQQPG